MKRSTTAAPRQGAALKALRRAPWSVDVYVDDPRLMTIDIRPIGDENRAFSLARWAAEVTAAGAGAAADVNTAAKEIMGWAERTMHTTLEDACRELIVALAADAARTLTPEWIVALMARLGVDGRPPRTLPEAGRLAGVGAERMRQVERVVLETRPAHSLWLPQIDEALLLARRRPQPVTEFTRLLTDSGLTATPWSVQSLEEALYFAGYDEELPVHENIIGLPVHVVVAIKRAISAVTRSPGVASTKRLAAQVSKSLEPWEAVDPGIVAMVARATPGIAWLTDTWFWSASTPPDRVRMRNNARTMLSVHSPLHVSDLIKGLARRQRMRGLEIDIPEHVARALFEQHPEFVVDEQGFVRPVEPLDYRAVLGPETQKMVDYLRELPHGVSDRRTIMAECTARGMDRSTAQLWLTYHEVVQSFGRNVWGLIGTTPPPEVVSAIQESARAKFERSEVTDGVDETGRPYIHWRATWAFIDTAVLGTANFDPRLVGRKLPAFDTAGASVGTISFGDDHPFIWGFMPYITRHEVKQGMFLRLTVDLGAEKITLEHSPPTGP